MSLPQIYGLVGYPVKHSLSPAMHNAGFKTLKINAEYKLFEVKPERLEEFLLKGSSGMSGFNITVPHKVMARRILEEKFPYQDEKLVQEALYYVKISGAVNTVKREGSVLKYWNTDATGFLRTVKEDLEFDLKNKTIILIGCGGVGRAIIAALSWANYGVKKIYVTDINNDAIESTKEHFSGLPLAWKKNLSQKLEFISIGQTADKIKKCQLLVNASSVGMEDGSGSVIDKNLLHKDLSVYDVVYNRMTQLIKDAESAGLNAMGGLGMLLYQGVLAFEIWTGQKAPVEVMRKALEEAITK